MQTDIWLTEEISHPERCPLCSVPLKKGSTTCFSCGFSTHSPTSSSVWIDPAIYRYPLSSSQRHPPQTIQQTGMRGPLSLSQPRRQPNPITPIPPRASAQPANAAPGSIVRTNQGNIYKRNEQRDASSLQRDFSALSNTQRNPTVWEYESSNFQAASSLQTLSLMISEAPTQPEHTFRGKATRRLSRIDEIDTTPVLNEASALEDSRALVPMTSQFGMTTSGGYGETTINVQPYDESNPSSWTAGEGSQSPYARLISSRSKHKKPHTTISLNSIDRVRWWLLRPGRIEFVLWLGGTILLVGVTCVLLLVTAFSFEWPTPGFIGATTTNMSGNSTGSQQQATASATVGMNVTRTVTGSPSPGPIVKRVPTSTPMPSYSPVVTPTTIPGGSGGQPTPVPVGQTPVPITPTPHPGTPTVTPTVGTTPTVTPTVGTTPTVTPTVGTTIGLTPTTSPAATGNPILGNALDQTGDSPLGKQLTHLSPWVWLMIACYSLSMVLLGFAGVLHKRRR